MDTEARCRLCGGEVRHRFSVALAHGLTGQYSECSACGFLRSSHLDDPAALALVYQRASADDDPGAAWRQHRIASRLRQLAAARVLDRGPGFRVLDFGTATGFLPALTSFALGWDVRGFDRYSSPSFAPRLVVRSWDEVERQAPYDLVIATELVEHLPDPLPELRRIGRLLRPGAGFVYATTSVYLPGEHDGSWHYLAPHTAQHCAFYTGAALAHVAGALGCAAPVQAGGPSEWLFAPAAGKGGRPSRRVRLVAALLRRYSRSGPLIGFDYTPRTR